MVYQASYAKLANGTHHSTHSEGTTKSILLMLTRRKLVAFLCIVFFCVTTVLYMVLRTGVINCSHLCNQVALPRLSDLTTPGPVSLRKQRFPHCIIIGIRKAGTRALLKELGVHPDIVTAGKEIHFFDNDESYALGLEAYRTRMPLSFDHQIVLEKTPAYFTEPKVPERIWAMNSSIKVLLIVREPLQRTVSDYVQLATKKVEEESEEVIPFEKEVLDSSGNVNPASKLIQISSYHGHLAKWLKFFPMEQIHVVDGDSIATDPVPELVKVEKFLGVRHYITKDDFIFNGTKGFYCIKNNRFGEVACLNPGKGRKHPDLKPELKRKLQEYFRPRNLKFFKMINRTFAWP